MAPWMAGVGVVVWALAYAAWRMLDPRSYETQARHQLIFDVLLITAAAIGWNVFVVGREHILSIKALLFDLLFCLALVLDIKLIRWTLSRQRRGKNDGYRAQPPSI